jgi:hypothetical protein
VNRPQELAPSYAEGYSSGISTGRPDRVRRSFSNERSIIASILTRLSIDVASVDIRHVRTDNQRRYKEDLDSGLNNCLTLEANALVPVDTSISPTKSGGYDILTLRVGDVVAWFPYHVRVDVFNEARGIREQVTLEKKFVAIIENPLYTVMNEPNSTLQRLIRKLNLLDGSDEQVASGKLDLIIQLPYVIKSEAKRQQADQRRKDIEVQLKGSQYGIAYTDGTEKITQLNRPAENNLLVQIEYLTKLLYSQLGLTEEVMLGTADEKAMINYFNRTVEPFLTAIVEAMRRSFLTKTARSQKQTIMFFRDPFRLAPLEQIAEIADKFTRNEIMTSNEIRQAMGVAPHSDPKADQLINSNMPVKDAVSPEADPKDVVVEQVIARAGSNGNGNGSNN